MNLQSGYAFEMVTSMTVTRSATTRQLLLSERLWCNKMGITQSQSAFTLWLNGSSLKITYKVSVKDWTILFLLINSDKIDPTVLGPKNLRNMVSNQMDMGSNNTQVGCV